MILVLKALLGSACAFAICYPLARLAVMLTKVPADFPPFTALPILSGVIVGPVCAAVIYALLRHFHAPDSERLFFFITLSAFVLSLSLPLRLSFTQSLRFAGVTPSAQMILVVMHAVVAAATFLALTQRVR